MARILNLKCILPCLFVPLLILLYTLASFPLPPHSSQSHVYHSLAALPKSSRSWSIYPDHFYEGGQYVTFPQGRTRYWLIGPENGNKIIFIHGLSIPSMIFQHVAPKIAAKGYRVLLYDLYGRGYSDAPQTTYDSTLYATQLALLMQHVGWDRAGVVGVSMGAAIGVSFADQFPHLVNGKVALIAPAGLLESSDISRTVKIMSSPLLQAFAASFPFRLYLRHLANSTVPVFVEPIHEIVRLQSAHLPGYNRALASSVRSGPIRGQTKAFTNLAASNRDVLLIHGTADRTVPYTYAATTIRRLVPRAELVTVEGGGHDLTITHYEVVCEALLAFFGRGKGKGREWGSW